MAMFWSKSPSLKKHLIFGWYVGEVLYGIIILQLFYITILLQVLGLIFDPG